MVVLRNGDLGARNVNVFVKKESFQQCVIVILSNDNGTPFSCRIEGSVSLQGLSLTSLDPNCRITPVLRFTLAQI